MASIKVWKMQIEKYVSKDTANDIKLYFQGQLRSQTVRKSKSSERIKRVKKKVALKNMEDAV